MALLRRYGRLSTRAKSGMTKGEGFSETRNHAIAYQGEPGAFSEAAARRVDAGRAARRRAGASKKSSTPSTRDRPATGSCRSRTRSAGSIHRNYDLLLDARAADRRRGRAAGRASAAGAARRDARAAAARVFASPGARAVRAVPAHAERRRDHCDLRHGGQREDGGRRRSWTDAAAIASARAGEVFGLTALASSIQDFDDNITRFLVVGTAAVARRRARQDVDRVLAAERAGLAVQGAERVRAARRRPDQARIAADSGPALGVPVLRRSGRGARRA